MPTGTMSNWNGERGFGFIKPDRDGDDLFAHVSELAGGEGSVREGDKVDFREEWDDRKGKYRAKDVKVVGGGGGGRRSRSRSGGRGGGYGRDRSRSRDRGYGGGGGGGGYGDSKGKGKGGKGESRPGDWECGKCGANVFASKSECFKCGEPKGGGGGGGGGGRGYDDRSRGRDDRDRSRGRDDRY